MRNFAAIFLLALILTAFQTTAASLPTSVHRKSDLFNLRSCLRCNKRLCFRVFKQSRQKCLRKKDPLKEKKTCIRKARKLRQRCVSFLFSIGKCFKVCIRLFKSPSPSPSITPSISSTPSATPSVTPSITPSITPSESPSPSATPSVTPSITPSESPTPSVTPSITPSITPSTSPTPSATSSITPSPSRSPGAPLCECSIVVTDSQQLDAVCTSMIAGATVTGASFGVIVRGSIRQCILDLTFTQDQLSRGGVDCEDCPSRSALDSCASNLRDLMVQRCFT